MASIKYNELVRDRIPEIIEASVKRAVIENYGDKPIRKTG